MAAKLVLTRKASFTNRRYPYIVLINGVVVGKIKNDDTEEYTLPPGKHLIQCKVSWMSSLETTVELKENTNTYLRVNSGMKFIIPLYILLFIGALLPYLFRQILKVPIPPYVHLLEIILMAPALIYYISYISIFRKKYLVITEDKSNPFR